MRRLLRWLHLRCPHQDVHRLPEPLMEPLSERTVRWRRSFRLRREQWLEMFALSSAPSSGSTEKKP